METLSTYRFADIDLCSRVCCTNFSEMPHNTIFTTDSLVFSLKLDRFFREESPSGLGGVLESAFWEPSEERMLEGWGGSLYIWHLVPLWPFKIFLFLVEDLLCQLCLSKTTLQLGCQSSSIPVLSNWEGSMDWTKD